MSHDSHRTIREPKMSLPRIASAVAALVPLLLARAAHAGPTVAADLDLGTSVGRTPVGNVNGGLIQRSPPLYIVGSRVRAGWRFDVGPFWIVPELGGGCDAQLLYGHPIPRVFGGARAGVSLPVSPVVRFEPGIYGHAGYSRYWFADQGDNAVASDVGLSLDFRVLTRLVVGAHAGYEVVTTSEDLISQGPFTNQMSSVTVPFADKWVGYGVHAGVLFW